MYLYTSSPVVSFQHEHMFESRLPQTTGGREPRDATSNHDHSRTGRHVASNYMYGGT